ncbi:MAG TPA: ketohydroxyglutarate aldolase [Candidatus Anaerostipes excrementavium]|uniref:Ketohydroxyglutarate aldolase n=1 Tax=Candidatus Anaerostipes excrementavium TaxID=2838463 RepID=A0A9D2B976_9FIRM|nr:ketohydroxyglutarate aldolase [uncultured Anaerostipes sp.]HIX67573.1 ketohydroxyglutarate aldolase [Candidatus Anaerostipes excrementavium]
MSREEIILQMKETGILGIVRVKTIERAYEIAQGCLDGGVNILEISYTNDNAGTIIQALKEKFKDRLIVGAGTVLEEVTARLAIMNGAQFIIAPSYDQGVQEICNLYQIPYAPGCTSYTEALTALKAGASFIKAFPISNFYGPQLSKIWKVPCPQVPIMASGGANFENLEQWIENGVDCIGIGGLLTKGKKEDIAKNAKRLTEIITKAKEG